MINWARIKEHVQKVDFWSPNKEIPDEHFEYVDISSINRLHKCIDHNVVPKLLGRDAPSRARQKINIEDVLVSTVRPNLNSIALTDNEFINGTASTGFCVLRAKSTLNPKYLFYWVQTNAFVEDMTKKASGASYPAVSDKIIKESKIPLPPLETQKKIAEIIDAADTIRQKTKTLIEKYDQLTQSLFLDMFGDPEINNNDFAQVKLNSLCSEIVDCPHSTPRKANKPTEFPCIRTSELVKGYIRWDTMQYLEEHEYIIRTKRLKPEAGDIVYAREGTFGKAVILSDSHKFSLGQRTILFRPDITKVNSIFLWAMIRSEFVYRQAKRKNTGSTVGHVNIKDIKKFYVLEPPLPLQNQFAERVQAIEEQKAKAQESLDKAEELFQSLLQKAFNGEIN